MKLKRWHRLTGINVADDIHSIKHHGTSWLVNVGMSLLRYINIHLCICIVLLISSETLHLPSSTCIDLLRVILYAICAAAVCLKYSRHRVTKCIGSSKFP